VLALLLALLLKKATDSNVTKVFDIVSAVGDLEPPKLNYGCNISVNGLFGIEGPF
jgi:hypothetical protein